MSRTRKHRRDQRGGAAAKSHSQKMLKLRTAYDNAFEKFAVVHDLQFERKLKDAQKEWNTQVKATETSKNNPNPRTDFFAKSIYPPKRHIYASHQKTP